MARPLVADGGPDATGADERRTAEPSADDRAESGVDVVVVVGTRPEIIKMAPVIRALDDSSLSYHLVHTNQHYDDRLSGRFFEVLSLPTPDSNLDIGSGSQAEQTASGLVGVERTVARTDPEIVLAQGDTNAVLSTALAASKYPVPFGHVEAGIRSYDRSMPEEVNRVVADHVATQLFAPTPDAADNLAAEGIEDGVHVTGNTVVDACREHAAIAADRSSILEALDVSPGAYVVATVHRPHNTDDDRLRAIVDTLDERPFPVLLPAHPRTKTALDRIDFDATGSLRILDPVDYLDFLHLESNARVIVTDSGGVQEEASILEVPCLTVRPNTERPETIDAGVNRLVEPTELGERLDEVYVDDDLHDSMTGSPDLYGDGQAGRRTVDIVERVVGRS